MAHPQKNGSRPGCNCSQSGHFFDAEKTALTASVPTKAKSSAEGESQRAAARQLLSTETVPEELYIVWRDRKGILTKFLRFCPQWRLLAPENSIPRLPEKSAERKTKHGHARRRNREGRSAEATSDSYKSPKPCRLLLIVIHP